QTLRPIKSISVNKIVLRRVQPVQLKIKLTPLKIMLRQIHACRAGSRQCGANRESTGVSKYVQHLPTAPPGGKELGTRCDAIGQHPPPILSLIEKEAHRVALFKTNFKESSIFLNHESLRRGCSKNQMWRGLLLGSSRHIPTQEFVITTATAERFH